MSVQWPGFLSLRVLPQDLKPLVDDLEELERFLKVLDTRIAQFDPREPVTIVHTAGFNLHAQRHATRDYALGSIPPTTFSDLRTDPLDAFHMTWKKQAIFDPELKTTDSGGTILDSSVTLTPAIVAIGDTDDPLDFPVGQLELYDTSDFNASPRTGGTISFGGFFNAANITLTTFAAIRGAKENATTDNADSFLAFHTRQGAVQGSGIDERMRLTSLGRLGIGGTAPGALLSVAGNAEIGSTFFGGGAPASGLVVEGDTGIGIAIPVARLHVLAAIAGGQIVVGTFRTASTADRPALQLSDGTTGRVVIGLSTADISVSRGGAGSTAGFVGIGLADATEAVEMLEVAGAIAHDEQAGDPGATADTGKVYTKDISTITELFYQDSAANVVQLTNAGAIGPLPIVAPSGLIGLAPVTGVASTVVASDSTHALDVGIEPTWTAPHTFSDSGGIVVSSGVFSSPEVDGGGEAAIELRGTATRSTDDVLRVTNTADDARYLDVQAGGWWGFGRVSPQATISQTGFVLGFVSSTGAQSGLLGGIRASAIHNDAAGSPSRLLGIRADSTIKEANNAGGYTPIGAAGGFTCDVDAAGFAGVEGAALAALFTASASIDDPTNTGAIDGAFDRVSGLRVQYATNNAITAANPPLIGAGVCAPIPGFSTTDAWGVEGLAPETTPGWAGDAQTTPTNAAFMKLPFPRRGTNQAHMYFGSGADPSILGGQAAAAGGPTATAGAHYFDSGTNNEAGQYEFTDDWHKLVNDVSRLRYAFLAA